MIDFCMAALMFLTGHEIKARTHTCVKIAHFLTQRSIRTWKSLNLQPHASQALVMYLIGKCAFCAYGREFLLPYVGSNLCGTDMLVVHMFYYNYMSMTA